MKYFDHKGPKIISVLCDMTVDIFEHLGLKSRKGIDKMWMYFEKVLRGLELTKFRNTIISCK